MGDYEESGPSEDACGVEDGGVGRCRGGGGGAGGNNGERKFKERKRTWALFGDFQFGRGVAGRCGRTVPY